MSSTKTFDKRDAITYIKRSYEYMRLSPAYLFTGEAREDKEEAAIGIAQALNCKKFSYPDCQCSLCQKIKSLQHPDVIWITSKDNKGSIKIEQIRELRQKIVLKPYELNKKVFIISEADRMTEEAQNALLKTLEEPPPDSILILISLDTQGLLDTIISRCRIFKFGKKKDLSDEFQRYEIIDKFLSQPDNIEQFFDIRTREEFILILEVMLVLYRDILILKSTNDPTLLINTERKEEIIRLTNSYSFDQLYQIMTFLGTMHKNLNLNLNLNSCRINTILKFRELSNM